MAYCKNCGAELPAHAAFCSKCGTKDPLDAADEVKGSAPTAEANVNAASSPAPTGAQPSPAPAQKKPADKTWFKNNFIWMYVIIGAVAIVLLKLGTMISYSAFGFGVTLTVFAILAAIAFCVFGIIGFAIADNRATKGRKHSNFDIICFALGIIVFVYVFVTAVVELKAAGDLWEAVGML